MRRRFPLFALLGLVLAAGVAAQTLVNDRNITIAGPKDVVAKRRALIDFIWGPGGMPLDKMPRLPVIRNDISPIAGLADLERVDTLVIEMDRGVISYAHHFIPKVKNNRLVILHQGHFSTFNDTAIPDDLEYGMRRTIEGLLGDGYSVLALYMPREADFVTSITVSDFGGLTAHDDLFRLDKYRPETGSPMKYFLEPVTACLNYLSTHAKEDNFPVYTDFSMVGFSGGGWTTTVYAAIDTRITLSIPVAGSIPLYLRSGASVGDTEQTLPEFYSIAGYPDLYVLGSDGDGRRQIQILNRTDWCCFSEVQHDPVLSGGMTYDESVRDYESRVRSTLRNLGNVRYFSLEIDDAAPGHTVTWDAIYDTILPELNNGRRYVDSATGDEVASRDLAGYPSIRINGVRSPSKLPGMIGTPALLRGAVNIYDMFYRTVDGRLVHVSRPPAIWSRPHLISEKVISNPAAVSVRPGTYDLVALKSDYKLYHFHSENGVVTSEQISEFVKGIGPPVIIATSPTQLDVLYKSWNRQLYHARKIGNKPWTVTALGGRMLDFPTAAKTADGTLHAFVRGLDGGLWEASIARDADHWSGWTSLSAPLNAPPADGSPSAVMANGQLSVYSRTKSGGLIVFSQNGQWSVNDLGGNYIGSPTATAGGTYMRDADGGLVFFDAQGRSARISRYVDR